MKPPKPIELDGRTGEGGVRIVHVRGNRPGVRGGGLKSQHVASIQCLADVTGADTNGLVVGSHTLEFTPRLPPSALKGRNINIAAESGAASTLLILQAVLPFLLYAGNEKGESIEVEISGGTNVSFSLSFEYLDQVLLPVLELRFGIKVERKLVKRGWSLGPQSRGSIWIRVQPLKPGQCLRLVEPDRKYSSPKDFEVRTIDISLIAPGHMLQDLQIILAQDLGQRFPDVELNFVLVEDSGHDSRIYTLLVARAESGLRWGSDVLSSMPKKGRARETIAAFISRKVCNELQEELAKMGVGDAYLQDQIVIFQALAEGRSSFPRSDLPGEEEPVVEALSQAVAALDIEEKMMKDKALEPFGHGSMHAQTARWVVSSVLPPVKWYNKGTVCEGVGMCFS